MGRIMNNDLTRLTRNDIIDLLEARGYNETSSDIIEVEYVRANGGNIVYKIKYYDIDDNILEDNIYVFIENGKLVADY